MTPPTIAGRLLVHLADQTVEVFAGRLVSIESGVSHELEAWSGQNWEDDGGRA